MRASIDKDRDMARSILPSRNREPARAAKAHIKRAARRRCRQACGALAQLGAYGGEDWDARLDLRAYPDAEIRIIVRLRRAGDKLNHFERWAIARTRNLPIDDRLGAMTAVLPGGLIGDHALSHLRQLREINPAAPQFWWNPQLRAAERERAQADLCRRIGRAVRILVEHGGHNELNAAIKRTSVGQVPRPPRRLLAGVHDIDDFVLTITAVDRGGPRLPHELEATMLVSDRLAPGWRNCELLGDDA
jgi:hypothetical protein